MVHVLELQWIHFLRLRVSTHSDHNSATLEVSPLTTSTSALLIQKILTICNYFPTQNEKPQMIKKYMLEY